MEKVNGEIMSLDDFIDEWLDELSSKEKVPIPKWTYKRGVNGYYPNERIIYINSDFLLVYKEAPELILNEVKYTVGHEFCHYLIDIRGYYSLCIELSSRVCEIFKPESNPVEEGICVRYGSEFSGISVPKIFILSRIIHYYIDRYYLRKRLEKEKRYYERRKILDRISEIERRIFTLYGFYRMEELTQEDIELIIVNIKRGVL